MNSGFIMNRSRGSILAMLGCYNEASIYTVRLKFHGCNYLYTF